MALGGFISYNYSIGTNPINTMAFAFLPMAQFAVHTFFITLAKYNILPKFEDGYEIIRFIFPAFLLQMITFYVLLRPPVV